MWRTSSTSAGKSRTPSPWNSQRKAEQAIKSGRFKDEIVPVEVPQKKGEPLLFDTDEYPKFGTTMEKLARLRPAFRKDGTVTAGNSSGVNDGAAAVLVMSEEKAVKMGIRPHGQDRLLRLPGLRAGIDGHGAHLRGS